MGEKIDKTSIPNKTPKKTTRKKTHDIGDSVSFKIKFGESYRTFTGEVIQVNEYLREVVLKLPKGNILKKKFGEVTKEKKR